MASLGGVGGVQCPPSPRLGLIGGYQNFQLLMVVVSEACTKTHFVAKCIIFIVVKRKVLATLNHTHNMFTTVYYQQTKTLCVQNCKYCRWIQKVVKLRLNWSRLN